MAYYSSRTKRWRTAGDGKRMGVVVDLDDRAFLADYARALKALRVATEQDCERLAYAIRNAATRYTPVDTGRLKSGWTVVTGTDEIGWFVAVINNVEYAAEVELGHETASGTFATPQPMIRPALAEALGIQGVGIRITPKWQIEV